MGALLTFPTDRDERNRRPREVRARTENIGRLPGYEVEETRVYLRLVGDLSERPKTRGGCAEIERPCPFVSCRHHLFLDVDQGNGSIKYNFPDIEPDEMEHSCSLDVANEGGLTLDDVGAVMNVTRERIRQIGEKLITKIRRHRADKLAEFVDEDPEKLDRSRAMGHGGRLGEGGQIAKQVAAQVNEDATEEERLPRWDVIWPADIYECDELHDAAAADRLWRMYTRASHSAGIGVDLTTAKAVEALALEQHLASKPAKQPGKDQPMTLNISDTRRAAILAAIKGGANDRRSIAAALGVSPVAGGLSIQAAVHEGVVIGVGNRKSRRYYLPGQAPDTDSRDLGTIASKPRTKKVPAQKAAPAKPKKASGAKPLAAAAVTAGFGGGDTARKALLDMRAKAQAKVDAIDEVLAQLGAS